jgi:hypothetical protein
MSNNVNEGLNESYVQEGIDAGLLDSRANLYCVWKMQREGHGTVKEYLIANTLDLPRHSRLTDTLNTVLRRNAVLKQKVQEMRSTIAHLNKEHTYLNTKQDLLKNEVKLTQQQLNAQYIRVVELTTEINKNQKKQKSDAT